MIIFLPGVAACRHGTVWSMMQKARRQWRHQDSLRSLDGPSSAPVSQQVSLICLLTCRIPVSAHSHLLLTVRGHQIASSISSCNRCSHTPVDAIKKAAQADVLPANVAQQCPLLASTCLPSCAPAATRLKPLTAHNPFLCNKHHFLGMCSI